MAKQDFIANPTPAQIAEWKKKHGDVFCLESENEEKFYIRAPKRNEYSYALSKMQSNPLEYVGSILRNCGLGGEKELMSDNGFLVGVMPQLDEVVNAREISVKKL